MSDLEPLLLQVTDIKQYRSCKRVVFYQYCLPAIRPITGKMSEGIERHREEMGREERRSLRVYGLTEGERQFDVVLKSTRLGLVGQIDLVITTANEAIPIEYKLSDRIPGVHVKAQLTAYALLLEEVWNVTVRRAFMYSLLERKAHEIAITTRQRNDIRRMVLDMQTMIQHERMPDAPSNQALCVSCEFRRFCNDVL